LKRCITSSLSFDVAPKTRYEHVLLLSQAIRQTRIRIIDEDGTPVPRFDGLRFIDSQTRKVIGVRLATAGDQFRYALPVGVPITMAFWVWGYRPVEHSVELAADGEADALVEVRVEPAR
jgi:hypothetical protein